MEEEINLLDYLRILKKYWWLITGLFLAGITATFFYTRSQPKTFKATTTIINPVQPGGGTLPAGMGGLASQLGFSGSGAATNTDLFVSILKSRSLRDIITSKFDYTNYSIDIKTNKENVLEFSVMDTNPQRAADIANAYAEQLDIFSQNLDISTASHKKKFIGERLVDTEKTLRNAEERLKQYQMTHKVLAEGEGNNSATVGGKLQGDYLAAKMKLEMMRQYATDANPELIQTENEIKEMEKQINLLPPLGTDMARMVRDLKVQETLYTYLQAEYEKAKIDEARDTPRIQVLDKAIAPSSSYSPSLSRNLKMGGIASLLFAILLSFFLEFLKKQ